MKLDKKNLLIQIKYSDLVPRQTHPDKILLGYGGELYLSKDELQNYDSGTVTRLSSFTKERQVALRMHAPVVDIDYRMIKNTAKAMVRLYEKIMKLCGLAGITHVVAHAEFGKDYSEEEVERGAVLWKELASIADLSGIILNIENHVEKNPKGLVALVERAGRGNIKLCFDVGHWNVFSDIGYEEWFLAIPSDITGEVHLADNMGDDDSHLSLGEGAIDFTGFFNVAQRFAAGAMYVLEPRRAAEAVRSLSFLQKEGFIDENE